MIIDLLRQFKLWNLSRKGYAQSAKIRHTNFDKKKNSWRYSFSMLLCLGIIWGVSCFSLFYLRGDDSRGASEYLLQFTGIFVFVVLIAYCLEAMRKTIFETSRETILITVISSIQILLSCLVFSIFRNDQDLSRQFVSLVCLPVALGSLFLAPLLGLRVAFCVAIYTGVIIALQGESGSRLTIFMMCIMSSIIVAIMVRRQRKRSMVICTIGVLFLIKLLFLFAIYNKQIIDDFMNYPWHNLALMAIICFSSVIIASVFLPVFEYLFGMITDQSLLELNDLNHPLLKKLQINAPGTYHHSLMVAIIAETAAEAIDVNPLLTRVCCYFHDIGKLMHPEYFTENNYENANFHDDLHPHMSSIIILNHVKEGVELAYKYKLNKVIRDAIMQHHGTSLISFFFQKAKDQHLLSEHAGDEDFRYPGPKVHRKEIAILSIADACEACIRSLPKPTPQKIRTKVEDIIRDRFLDHQLDDADLTFEELNIVKETIIKTLAGMMHGRIQYPHPGPHYHEHSTVKTNPSEQTN